MKEPLLIDIHNATVWRGTTRVFHGLSLKIGQHERVAILGPNGSGKTTLLKTINRELYPVADENSWIRILGHERWNVWDLRSKIGLVSHDLHSEFSPHATALEVIVSGFFSSIGVHSQLVEQVSQSQIDKAHTLLHSLGLDEVRDRAFQAMSTGQQRRCLLGRALVHDPQTLILDEPTSGLDLTAGFDYLERIRNLALGGRSLVMVTHHLNEIPPEINRVVVLKQGNIAADGPKDMVLTSELMSEVYEARIGIHEIDGHFMAFPGR
jgi:iron complex transport system ATP-binding protein